ncbi:hypothetical protein GPDM_02440 [Planococcus donghaensis MPA1U2]|uniref:Uncharacterized protein n=1 Tax=Planococcus donghaensis MPA1U2 TaxID=933115 RepID=E7RDG0_9BACL|nr:hypothetical protein GPDM_02440 [Planococcus donghaensis MPA1U2]
MQIDPLQETIFEKDRMALIDSGVTYMKFVEEKKKRHSNWE